MQAVQVGRQEIAPELVLLHLIGFRKLLPLVGKLSGDAFHAGHDEPEQVIRTLLHPGTQVTLRIEFIQRRTARRHLTHDHQRTVLLRTQEEEILQSPFRCLQDVEPAVPFTQPSGSIVNDEQQAFLLVLGQLPAAHGIPADVVRPLPCQQRRYALKHADQSLIETGIRRQEQGTQNSVILGIQEIEPVRPVRHLIGKSGQQDTLTGHIRIALEAVDHLAVLADEDEVGIPPHDLAGKRQEHPVSQFIRTLKIQKQDAFQSILPHRHQLAAAQVLAQEHTEHRRRRRIFDRDLCQMDPGAVAGGADEDPGSTVTSTHI